MTSEFREADPDQCADCELSPDRRDAVRDGGVAALGALIMVGMPPVLAAMPSPTAPAGRTSLLEDEMDRGDEA